MQNNLGLADPVDVLHEVAIEIVLVSHRRIINVRPHRLD